MFSPSSVTFAFALVYLGIVISGAGGDPLELARVGTQFSLAESSGSEGYDGQFVYFIAHDPNPESVKGLLDVPAYRYQRILLPVLARTLSFGDASLIPWVLPALSLFAHTGAVLLLSKMLEGWSLSRWYALSYGLWMGVLLALRLDLPEALAFALVIAAIFNQLRENTRYSWFFFALALFAKETTLFFLGAQLLVYLYHRRWRDLVGLSLIALLPYALFQLWLLNTFGQLGLSSGGIRATPIEWIPFMGIWRINVYSFKLMAFYLAIYAPIIIVPAIWGLWASARKWRREGMELTSSSLFLNALIIPFLPFSLYSEPFGAFRFATGLVLAIVLFAGRYRMRKILNFTLFWLALNLVLIGEVIS